MCILYDNETECKSPRLSPLGEGEVANAALDELSASADHSRGDLGSAGARAPCESARVQGALWGARANDWADIQEPLFAPLHEAALDVAISPDARLLDVGCGAGGFCDMASKAGARVYGIDAAEALIAIAKKRTPDGRFCVGDMEALPYPEGSFDAVVGINSFGHAANPLHALQEARRVAADGATVVVTAWSAPEDSGASALFNALAELLPRPQQTPKPPSGAGQATLEELLAAARLTVVATRKVQCPWTYPDEKTALRGVLSAGPFIAAERKVGETTLKKALLDALAPFRMAGGYRLDNTFRAFTAVAT